jgi:hypothetical protein
MSGQLVILRILMLFFPLTARSFDDEVNLLQLRQKDFETNLHSDNYDESSNACTQPDCWNQSQAAPSLAATAAGTVPGSRPKGISTKGISTKVVVEKQVGFNVATPGATFGSLLDLDKLQMQAATVASQSNITVIIVTGPSSDERSMLLRRSLNESKFSSVKMLNTENGFSWLKRLQLWKREVDKAASVNPDSVFLFLDAFDVVTFGTEQELLVKFQQTT